MNELARTNPQDHKALDLIKRKLTEPKRGPETAHGRISKLPHTDMAGGNAEVVSSSLVALVYPDVEKVRVKGESPIFVLDFSGRQESAGLLKTAYARGHRAYDWEVSPESLLQILDSDSAAGIIAASMPSNEKTPRDVERELLSTIFKTLEDPDSPEEHRSVPLSKVRDAISVIIDSRAETSLDASESERIDERFSSTDYRRDNIGRLINIRAHINNLLSSNEEQQPSEINHNDDEPVRLFNCRVTPGLDTNNTSAMEVLLLAMTEVIQKKTPIGEPPVLVVAGAERANLDRLDRLREACNNKEVRSLYVYGEVNEQVVQHLWPDGSGMVILGQSNGKKAEELSTLVGGNRDWVQTGRSSSSNKSVSRSQGSGSKDKSTSTSSDRGESWSHQDERHLPAANIQRLGKDEMLFVERKKLGGAITITNFMFCDEDELMRREQKSAAERAMIEDYQGKLLVNKAAGFIEGWRKKRAEKALSSKPSTEKDGEVIMPKEEPEPHQDIA